MTSRRVLSAVLMLLVAIMACSPGGTTLPATDTPAPRPTNTTRPPRPTITARAPTQEVATQEVATQEVATQEQPTSESPTQEQPTQQSLPTRVPATRVPRPTATAVGSSGSSGSCGTFKATNGVVWVTLDSAGNVDQQVDSYPDGTTTITPLFEYDCVPKALTLVISFSFNGQQVFSDKAQLKATSSKSSYGYPLGTKDGSPVQNGDWSVSFFDNNNLVAQGAVTVGGGGTTNGNGNGNGNSSTDNSISVQGSVTDQASGNPISGAAVGILKAGVNYSQFVKDKYAAADILTQTSSDAQGQFTLPQPVQRNQVYTLVAVAKGYQVLSDDNFTIDNSVADPAQLTIQLVQ